MWTDEWGALGLGFYWIISYQSGRIGKRMERMERIGTDFFPPAADVDEPKARQSPF